MTRLEDMMNKIGSDNKVPNRIWEKLDYALDTLPDHEKDHEKDHAPCKKTFKYAAAAAALTMAAGITLCYSNPALAAKIPFIGKIFEEVEHEIPFSGDYSEKAGILAETAGKDEDGNPIAAPGIKVSDGGITVTASEIYCDGLSVFLTAQIEAEQGGLLNIPGHYIGDGDGTAAMMYLRGEWNLSEDSEPNALSNDNLEGKVIDDHTFVGMLKLNLPDYKSENGELSLRLSSIGWDDTTMADAEDISESHRIDGQWDFDIPFSIDTESVKEYPVNKEGNGYTLKKVFVSPYQVVSYVDVPSVKREVTREEYEEVMAEKTGGTEDPGISYEEYAMQAGQTYPFWSTVICNQDGQLLFSNPAGNGKTVAAVDGKKISALHIFVFDDMDADLEIEKSRLDNENGAVDLAKAREKAVIAAEVPID